MRRLESDAWRPEDLPEKYPKKRRLGEAGERTQITLKIVTANINGLQSAIKYGFFDWLTWQSPDIVCLQELNVQALPSALSIWAEAAGFEIAFQPAADGNGGVAILSRHGFDAITTYDERLEIRGRCIGARVASIEICSAYVSLNNTAAERDAFQSAFDTARSRGRHALICGDFNIIANREDAPSSFGPSKLGCKPEERRWLNALKDEWVDVLPRVCPERPLFTFWVRNADRFENNLGTRIDYQLASPELAERAVPQSGKIFRDYYHGARITDHGPITIEYDV